MERITTIAVATIAAAALAVAGCGGDDVTQASCAAPDSALKTAVAAHLGVVETGPDEQGRADRLDTDICRTSDTSATATVTLVGLRDDSIRDWRHELTLERGAGGEWRITGDVHTYRCNAGRGQQSFAEDLCV